LQQFKSLYNLREGDFESLSKPQKLSLQRRIQKEKDLLIDTATSHTIYIQDDSPTERKEMIKNSLETAK
jgi:hypothetical protein